MKTRSKKPLASLGKGKSTKVKLPSKKPKAPPAEAPIATAVTQAECYRWWDEWKTVPGCPEFVKKGMTSDGFYGVAIFHEDDSGELVSHVCYSSKPMRDLFAKALRYLYRAGTDA